VNPVNNTSDFFSNKNFHSLKEILSVVATFQFNLESQDETNNKICQCCQAVIFDITTQEVNIIDGFLLLRSMRDFMEAGVDGFKEGKTAIRECFDRIHRILPNFQRDDVDIDDFSLKIFSKSYPRYFDMSAFLQLFYELNQKAAIPSEVFSYLVNFDLLDEPMKKMLYTVLSKSGMQINAHFILICKSLRLQNDLGLTHRHLLDPSEDDTDHGDYTGDVSTDLDMVIDYKFELQLLNILAQESDGGYQLLKKAEFLSIGGVNDLLECIEVIKNNQSGMADDANRLIMTYLQIASSDRMDVLMEVLHLVEKWKMNASVSFKLNLLIGVGAVPPECRDRILALLPTYQSYEDFNNILYSYHGNNGITVAYLLYPNFLTQSFDVDNWRKILTSILWEKLLDHSLPVFTLTSLAHFLREIGVPGDHPLRLLGQIMRTSPQSGPERAEWIHNKIEANLERLSQFKCPLSEILNLNKRENEGAEGGPVQKKARLG
jgi:hypothetical protein